MEQVDELYKKPRRCAFFWGALILTAGVLILINSIADIPDGFRDLYKFWPLILILVGLGYFINNDIFKKVVAGLNGAILAVVIFSFISSSIFWIGNIPEKINGVFGNNDAHKILADNDAEIYESIADDNVKFAALDFEMGANDIYFTGMSDNLLDISSNYDILNVDWKNENDTALISIETNKSFSFNSNKNNATAITVSDSVAWDFDLTTYACNLELDFAQTDVKNLIIDTKASSVVLYCPIPKDTMYLEIDSQMSSFDIYVPKDAYCLMDLEDNKFSSINVEGDFSDNDDYQYEFNASKKSSGKVIIISGDVDFGSVRVVSK